MAALLTLIALILPLSLDTFAVCAALGMARIEPAHRLRVSLVLTVFEAGMPVVGLLLGAIVGQAIGEAGGYLAMAALAGLGAYMALARGDDAEASSRLARTQGFAILGLGVAVSLDEIAMGFSLGLLHAPIVLAVVLIAAQAFVASQAGLRLGRRAGEAFRETAERAAGVALIVVAVALLVAKVAGLAI